MVARLRLEMWMPPPVGIERANDQVSHTPEITNAQARSLGVRVDLEWRCSPPTRTASIFLTCTVASTRLNRTLSSSLHPRSRGRRGLRDRLDERARADMIDA
jgi:hypothetical protein